MDYPLDSLFPNMWTYGFVIFLIGSWMIEEEGMGQ
jgi:hypothetical protein